MGQIREKMKQELSLRGLAESTHRAYLAYARAYVAHFRRSPVELGTEHVRAWLLYLLITKKSRPATVNVALAAVKFLYGATLGKPEVTRELRSVRRTFPAPDVLSGSEVKSVIENAASLKHKAMFMLMYGAGLRISEVCKLSARDIDSKRMVVLVRVPKNRHDRVVPLAARTLEVLRDYWKQYRPEGEYLFPGQDAHKPITRNAVQLALKKAAGRALLKKRVYPHLLRHAFATHSLELGTDIRTLQILLGHLSIKSTTRYTHLTETRRLALKLPVRIARRARRAHPLGLHAA